MYVIELAKDSYKLDEPACHHIALSPWNTQMKKDSCKLSQNGFSSMFDGLFNFTFRSAD